MSRTEGSGASRAGGEGFHNEDAFVVDEGVGLYIVCDGASETPAGEVAARIAAQALERSVERSAEDEDLRAPGVAQQVVARSMERAIAAVTEAGQQDPQLTGLATTVTLLLAHGRWGVIGHRGDSRAYLIRRDRARQLTVDHDLRRPEGAERIREAELDVFGLDFEPGDTVVLCTDGAEEVVQEDEIVRAAGMLGPRVLASRIVSLANRRRPERDATAVVVRVRRDLEWGGLELSGPPRDTRFGHTLQPAWS